MNNKFDIYITFPGKSEIKETLDWINNFKTFLSILLEKLLKRKVSIVVSNDKEKKEALKSSTNYIVLFNNEYDNKEFLNEIKEIIHTAKQNFEQRVYKVFTTKIDFNDYAEFLGSLISYNFYSIDAETGKSIEFTDIKGQRKEKLFWLKLVDLAYDIYHNMLKLEAKELKKTNGQKIVYLAETGQDQLENRDVIRRELLQHGYKVVPEKHINLKDKQFTEELNNLLKKACMSIHIIGEDYNQSQNEENSVCAIQNSIASAYYGELEKSKQPEPFHRIIWISPDLNLRTEIQRNAIEQLKQDEEALRGAEVVQTPIELLKTVIHNKLAEEHQFDLAEIKADEEKKKKDILSVYLIYDKSNIENIKTVRNYFEKHHFEILNPIFEGSEYDLIRKHKSNLVKAEMAFIYHNNNNEWLNSKIKDILKSPGFGRTKPFISRVIYYNESQQIELDKFTKENFLVLKGKSKFDPEILDPLFKSKVSHE